MNTKNINTIVPIGRIALAFAVLLSVMAFPSDGLAQSPLPGVNNVVFAAVRDGSGNLYAGGTFTSAGGVPAANIARWNGVAWTAVAGGVNGRINALATDGANIFVGGYFTQAGGQPAAGLAVYLAASDQWLSLANSIGTGMTISALQVDQTGYLYVGGTFTTINGVTLRRVGRLNLFTGAWDALGQGLNGNVRSLALHNGTLYVGGGFTRVRNGIFVNRIAAWNIASATWSALGGGANNSVDAIAVDPSGTVYIGGQFNQVNGTTNAGYIAYWDGAAWVPLPAMDDHVRALAYAGGRLYAGGVFTFAGGVPANRIAYFDGGAWAWNAMGAGMNAAVEAIDAGGELAAGGRFITADGITVNYITTWSGTVWEPLIPQPTPVTLDTFEAAATPAGVRVTWVTVQEVRVIGFNVLRGASVNGPFTKANPWLIPAEASGQVGGASYAFDDAPGGAYYVLEVINQDGTTERYGPIAVSR